MHILLLTLRNPLLLNLLIVVSIGIHSLPVTGATVGTGWPSGLPRHPLLVLDSPDAETDIRSDASAEKWAFRRALDLHEKLTSSIAVTGLFVDGRILSEGAIVSLLIGNGLSYVETTPANVRWIFFIARNPGAEALKASGKKYVRFRLEKEGSQDCFRGNDESPYFSAVRSLPKRVNSCVVLDYSDELLSDFRLGIDLTNHANRIAYYDLSSLRSGQPNFRFPFWASVRRGVLQVPDDYSWTDIALEKKVGRLINVRSSLSSLLLRLRGPNSLPLE